MKTVFVVNPMAGKKDAGSKLCESIKTAAKRVGADADIYITKAVGDASLYVRKMCESGEKLRFIACGGDGTLGEVINGAAEFDGVEVGVMPYGTGNDFCRNFDSNLSFLNPEAQLLGTAVKCDAIKYHTECCGSEKSGYCINMFNIGFDCNVVDMTDKMKKNPLISGSFAYFLSIFAILIKKKGADLDIFLDGNKVYGGKLLLTSIANGSFCGGGIKSNPLADIHNGLMNINIIKNVSRLNFISKLPCYMKGTHMQKKGIEKILYTENCKEIEIVPRNGMVRICSDGEIFNAGKTRFEIIHDAVNFVVPSESRNCPLQAVQQNASM